MSVFMLKLILRSGDLRNQRVYRKASHYAASGYDPVGLETLRVIFTGVNRYIFTILFAL